MAGNDEDERTLPEVEGAHDETLLEQLPCDQLHDGVILAATQRCVGMSDDSTFLEPLRLNT